MMALNTPKECPICTDEFDEEAKSPRILPCFHILCTSCIDNMIQNNRKKCPSCRRVFSEMKGTDFRISTNTLEFIKYIRELEATSSPHRQRSDNSPSKCINDFKQQMAEFNTKNILSFQKAQVEIITAIKKNNEFRDERQEVNKMFQATLTKTQEEFSTNKRHIKLLDKENKRLEEQLETLRKQQNQIQALKDKMDKAKKFSVAGSLVDDAEKLKSQFENTLKDMKHESDDSRKTFEITKAKLSTIHETWNSSGQEKNSTSKDSPGVMVNETISVITDAKLMTIQETCHSSGQDKDSTSEEHHAACQDDSAVLATTTANCNIAAEEGTTAIALYDFHSEETDELSFDPGDIITNIEKIDEEWWKGCFRGKYGLFPANFVQVRTTNTEATEITSDEKSTEFTFHEELKTKLLRH